MVQVPVTLGSPASIDAVSARSGPPLPVAGSLYRAFLIAGFLLVHPGQSLQQLEDLMLYHFASSKAVCSLV